MSESAASCAHCGKQGVGFQRCSKCKQAWYCGAECQKAGWKKHKKGCEPPVALIEVVHKVNAAHDAKDWRGVIKWEGRMDEMLAHQPEDKMREHILDRFSNAYKKLQFSGTGSNGQLLSTIKLEDRRIQVLGDLQRFRDQGEALCENANRIRSIRVESSGDILDLRQKSARDFERGRAIGAAHGFFSVECQACIGLGSIAMGDGRHEEGVELLQNALAASRLQLTELDDDTFEMGALEALISALFKTNAMDDVQPLVERYREAAKKQSEREGGFCYTQLDSLYYASRLQEVRIGRQLAG